MSTSVNQFGKDLVASGLITADELKAHWGTLPSDARPKDGEAFAKSLVERGKLTEFQAQEILAGRGARLVMGEYVVLEEVGAGGMGHVYKARHRRMERIVALKVMSAAAMKDEANVKRFQREVKAAARLEHPNIVTAYDSGEAGAVKYLVMQFVDGDDLASLVRQHGPLAIDRAVGYAVQAARGLAFAHGEGVIHRDIKPANLLVDKKGVVKILDMGLARIESGDDGLTGTEQVMGTVDYMSPEQAAQTKGVDGRADIYSLGCSLWYLLTGKRLYSGETMISRLIAHRDGPLPSLTEMRDDVPWQLEEVLHKMVAKLPQDRFQTMDDVAAALEPFAPASAPRSGSASSSGLGPALRDADRASYSRASGPGSKSQLKPAPTKTAKELDVTQQFNRDEDDTDPQSQVLPAPPTAVKSRARSATAKGKKPPVMLIAGGIGGLVLLVALGAWFFFGRPSDVKVAGGSKPPGQSNTAAAPIVSEPTTSHRTVNVVYLDDLVPLEWKNGRALLGKRGTDHNGAPFLWLDKQPAHALFTHPESTPAGPAAATFALDGKYETFQVTVGLARSPPQPVIFRIWCDDVKVWDTPPQYAESNGLDAVVDVRGVRRLRLEAECVGNSQMAHAVWINPRLTPVDEPRPAVVNPAAVVYLDDLKEAAWQNGLRLLGKHGNNDSDNPFNWRGSQPAHSLMTSPKDDAACIVQYALEGKYDTFAATVGRPDNLSASKFIGTLTFRVLGDGKELWKSQPIQKLEEDDSFSVPVAGVRELQLEVHCEQSSQQGYAVWIDPRLTPVK